MCLHRLEDLVTKKRQACADGTTCRARRNTLARSRKQPEALVRLEVHENQGKSPGHCQLEPVYHLFLEEKGHMYLIFQ